MPSLGPLTPADIAICAALHPAREHELQGRMRWLMRTAYAHHAVAQDDERVFGWAAAVRFGTHAWLTDLYAAKHEQGGAACVELVQHLITELEAQGAVSQTAQVPQDQVVHWRTMGFVEQGSFLEYSGGQFYQAADDEAIIFNPEHNMGVLRLDQLATGEDRSAYVLEHAYLGRAYVRAGRVRGFLLPLAGHGLLVADSAHVGLELQRWHFPTQSSIILPKGNAAAHEHLVERGYAVQDAGVRMVRGTPPAYRPEMVFAHPFRALLGGFE